MTHQSQPSGAYRDLLDIVFANRNQAYGAYQLRRTYPDALARALGGGFLVIGAFFLAVHLLDRLGKNATTYDVPDDTTVILSDKKQPEVSKPQVLKTTATGTAQAKKRFVPPLIVSNGQAPEPETQNAQADLIQSNADVGANNQAGETDGPPDLTDIIGSDSGTGNGSRNAAGDPTVYDMSGVHKPPSFPGGEQELLLYLSKHIRYPEAARIAGLSSQQAVVSFVVNADGSISDLAVLKDPGAGCGKEVLRVVSSMPQWTPGESNGHPVRVRFYLPVRFELK